MRKKFPPVLLTIILFLATNYSFNTVLLSGRRQVAFLPESMLVEMSLTSYNDFLSGQRLSSDSRQTAMVKNSGTRIAEAVESYLREQGLESRINEFKWEFNLIDEDVPNAWAMPGGKIVFYSGIMPITGDESGVAVVMGHEIAHVVARQYSSKF